MLGTGHSINDPKGLVVWGGAFALIWGMFTAYFLIDLVSDNAVAVMGVETTGTVVAVQRVYSRRGPQGYRPSIEFRCPNGVLYTFQGERVQEYQAGEIGDEVPVIYMPDDPGTAIINDSRTRFNSLFGVMATLPGLLLGLFILRFNLLKLLDGRKTDP